MLALVAVCLIMFALHSTNFRLEVALMQSAALLFLGCMILRLSDAAVRLKQQLLLLKEVTHLSNPRFGSDYVIGSIMERLRVFYSADSCVMVTTKGNSRERHLRRADRSDPKKAVRVEPITPELLELLVKPSPTGTLAVAYRNRVSWLSSGKRFYVYDTSKGKRANTTDPGAMEEIAVMLNADSFIGVPLCHYREPIGMLYLAAQRPPAFANSDAVFLVQIVEQIMPVIENLRLVDGLASEAAAKERQKISRDLHDSVIQPYIGLQFGLAAIRKKLNLGDANVAGEVELLFELTGTEIAEMRSVMRSIRGAANQGRKDSLIPAVQRFAAKFTDTTGIAVHVTFDQALHINDRLAAEAFQIVAEGLSNIRRHTQSTRATIHLSNSDDRFTMRIHNDSPPQQAAEHFVPGSITARADSLGGRVQVEQGQSGTTINIEIPL